MPDHTSSATSIVALRATELSQELDHLLDAFCSDMQQKFCRDQRVATDQQLHRIRQTIQQVRGLVASVGLVGNPNSASLRQSLISTSLEMLDHYNVVCRQHHIRSLNSEVIPQLMSEWQELSQTFDTKAKEQTKLGELLRGVRDLRHAWKRPRQVNRIMTSILATYEPQDGTFVVLTDRHNYGQLGLKRKAVGSKHLVFQCSRLSRDEQMDIVCNLCRKFATVFAQNAQQNLLQIDAQIRIGDPAELTHRLELLRHQICSYSGHDMPLGDQHHPPASTRAHTSTSSSSSSCVDSTSGHLRLSNNPSLHIEVPPTEQDQPPHQRHQPHQPHHHHHHHDDQRLDSRVSSFPPKAVEASLWFPNESIVLQRMPTPSFIPSPWQWPDFLKVRRPYQPRLFGLIKRRRYGHTNAFFIRLRNLFSSCVSAPRSDDTELPDGSTAVEMFATLSMTKLGRHFCRTGRQFYEDVADNVHLRYNQDGQVLKKVGQELVDLYGLLQLEASRMAMQRILTIIHTLNTIDHEPEGLATPPH